MNLKIMLGASPLSHSTTQSVEMPDSQIFAFLVMPFLFVLTCSMVFVSSRNTRSQEPADPPKPVTRPNSYARKPRRQRRAARQAEAAED
jgi:hypothetical protein